MDTRIKTVFRLSWLFCIVSLRDRTVGQNIVLQKSSSNAVVGSPYTLTCQISDHKNSTGDITFYTDQTAMCFLSQSRNGCEEGMILEPGYSCSCGSISNQRRIYSLSITALRQKDGNHWGCFYNGVKSNFIKIALLYPPSVKSFRINSRTVKEGARLNLTCDVTSMPVSRVQLKKGSQVVCEGQQGRARCHWEAKCEDSGAYTCSADNGIQPPDSRNVNMVVKCSPRLDERINTRRKLLAMVSDNVTLLLHTIASPRPTFKWFKLENGMSKKLGETKPKIFTNAMAVGECILSNVGVCDSGEYRVVVHNGVGADFVMDYTVEVQGSKGVDQSELRETRDEPDSTMRMFYWTLPSLGLFCVAILILYIRRFRKKKDTDHQLYNFQNVYSEPTELDTLQSAGVSAQREERPLTTHIYEYVGSPPASEYQTLSSDHPTTGRFEL